MQEILYKVHNNLYVNLTNKCPCSCTFCLRQSMDTVGESNSLWLDHDPDFEEVKAEFAKFKIEDYDEIVFCGFGEPTCAFDVLIRTAKFIKETYNKPIRINTNGLGNLVNGRDITPELEGLIDTVSISLNTPDPKKYLEIVRPRFKEGSYEAMLDFASKAARFVPKVVLTTVATTITEEEEKQCAAICDSLGVSYRIRPFES